MRITVMNEAIQAMEKHKTLAHESTNQLEDGQSECAAPTETDAVRTESAEPQAAARSAYPPLIPLWSIECVGFRAGGFAASGEYPAMIRLNATARPNHYIKFPVRDLPMLLAMLTAADAIRPPDPDRGRRQGNEDQGARGAVQEGKKHDHP